MHIFFGNTCSYKCQYLVSLGKLCIRKCVYLKNASFIVVTIAHTCTSRFGNAVAACYTVCSSNYFKGTFRDYIYTGVDLGGQCREWVQVGREQEEGRGAHPPPR